MDYLVSSLVTNIEVTHRTLCGTAWSGTWQNHLFSRLYWVVDGEGFVAHHEQTYPLRPGYLSLIPARAATTYHCPDHMDIYWIHFTARVLGVLDLFSLLDCDYTVQVDRSAEIQDDWDRLQVAHAQQTVSGMLQADSALRALLACFLERATPAVRQQHIQGYERFHQVYDYIERHLDRPLSLSELAEVVHLHPTYFANLFSRTLGEGPLAYVTRRRIECAQALLWGEATPLSEIARMVGYKDPFYFSRVFTKVTGIPPSEFRRRGGAVIP